MFPMFERMFRWFETRIDALPAGSRHGAAEAARGILLVLLLKPVWSAFAVLLC